MLDKRADFAKRRKPDGAAGDMPPAALLQRAAHGVGGSVDVHGRFGRLVFTGDDRAVTLQVVPTAADRANRGARAVNQLHHAAQPLRLRDIVGMEDVNPSRLVRYLTHGPVDVLPLTEIS